MITYEIVTAWATILSPIIAVIIAIGAYYDNRKSSRKQMDAMRIVCRQQINVQLTMLETELQKMAMERHENQDEIIQLSTEISCLFQKNADKAEINVLQAKINRLKKQVGFKGNRVWQIINTQFTLLQQSNKLKDYDF